MERYLSHQIQEDLKKKMVFMGGPRQVGKTTLARSLLKNDRGYLNWDVAEDREAILKRELPIAPLWEFDEIHKYRSWRGYLKGLYDRQRAPRSRILVTGSARLDYYRFGGDSLQGRYHYLRLHPLSAAELGMRTSQELGQLLRLGGFPELVGSPLSINSIREDLQVSHKAVANWIEILGRLYSIFLLSPFGAPRIRAVKKERKHYHFDWTLIADPALRFENLVASHLMKWVHFEEDSKGRDLELRFFRDVDGREVDFVVTEDKKPLWFVECKWSDSEISPGLRYMKARFPKTLAWQISAEGKKEYVSPEGIRVCPAIRFLKELV